MDNKLVLIDGNSIFYRSYYALPPSLKNEKGEPTNAIYGFANILVKIINEIKPTHLAVAFDVTKKTFRNAIFSEYKATRKPMPEDLRVQIPLLKEMLSLMNIKILEKPNNEADDILGTIAARFDEQTIIVTGDRDAFQLISPTTVIYWTKKGISEVKLMDEKALYNEYKLSPSQMIDLKSLAGDNSDNIPGVPGIGDVTALSLMQKYGSLDEIYKNLNEITGKLNEKLVAGKELAYVSQQLATINNKMDIQCELTDLIYDFPFNSNVFNFMKENNFRSLISRGELFGATEKVVRVERRAHRSVITKEEMEIIKNAIIKCKEFAFFIDSVGYHLAYANEEIIFEFKQDLFNTSITVEEFYNCFGLLFQDGKIKKVCFDTKSVMHSLSEYGVSLKENYFDVSIARHLESGNSVKTTDDIFIGLDLDETSPAVSLLSAMAVLSDKLIQYKMKDLFYDVELPLVYVLFKMEQQGFKVDVQKLEELGKKYKAELDALIKDIYKEAGHEFNINSPKQLMVVLFDELNLLGRKKKKTTNIEMLEQLQDDHPIVPLVIRYRKLAKLYSTYIEGLRAHLDPDNFIHTSFKQTLTTTGRLSSTEPNLQNIPIRTEESREIRSVFLASREDHVIVDADYSQIELRLLAHFSEDEDLIYSFKNNLDIHTRTASNIFNVKPNEVTSEMRRMAKVVNFGIIYGMSEYGLASDLKINKYQAKDYIDEYYEHHPKVGDFMQGCINSARETGRATTILGRTRKMLDINASNRNLRMRAERASQNMPLQGSAADIIKVAMVNIDRVIQENGLQAKLIMQVHDELIIDCPKSEQETVVKIIKKEMEGALKLSVPLIVDETVSYRWSEGH